jgi:hypothetical protein
MSVIPIIIETPYEILTDFDIDIDIDIDITIDNTDIDIDELRSRRSIYKDTSNKPHITIKDKPNNLFYNCDAF